VTIVCGVCHTPNSAKIIQLFARAVEAMANARKIVSDLAGPGFKL